MEFIDLSRYMEIKNPKILPFAELRNIKPVLFTQDLKLVETRENVEYANSFAEKGMTVVPLRRIPPKEVYLDRKTFPRRILFEMTSRCNFLCRMCPQNNLKRPRMDMDAQLYKKIIDEIDANGIEGIWLYHLGESLLHPDYEDMLKHISTKKNLGVIWISTNGELFDENKIKLILNSNVDYINFSAHAVTKETYNTVITYDVFEKVQANLEKFFELKGKPKPNKKPFMHVQMIEQETTKNEVDAFINKHYQRADIVSINMLEYVNMPNNAFGAKQRERKPLTSCLRVSRNDCFICSNGAVTLCDAAYNGEINLGNVNEQSLYDIWNGEERARILDLNEKGRMFEIDFCTKCTDYDI